MSSDQPLPSPEEIQKKLSEFMKQEFGDRVVFSSPHTETVETTPPVEEPKRKEIEFNFHLKPKEVKAHLDRFVIQQEDAKKALAIAVCDHYNHVKAAERGEELRDYVKQNVLLIGPTGVGKTYLIKTIADLIGVPFVKADATKFSETGYVGGDVEDLVRELIHRADGDVSLASYGIVYLDEIDKIATPAHVLGRDVSGRGVQTNLLKLMEETEVPLRSPTDIQAQLQAAFEYQRRGKVKRETINTRHILFIVSGAFDQMLEIIRKRVRQADIGFGGHLAESVSEAELQRRAQTEDFVKYGFEPEFIGRLPVRVVLDKLTVADLYHILKQSEGSVIKQYESSFHAFGIDVMFSDDGLHAVAEKAALENTGARGLLTVCERGLREFKFELPSSTVRQFVVTRSLVENPEAELQRILKEPAYEQRELMRQLVHDFERRFEEKHKLRMRLEPDAVEEIIERAQHANKSVTDLCCELFKDYQFGLNLVKNNAGQSEFVIPKSALADPDKFLSNWVVSSYRKDEPAV
ncbi:MAG TPA: AAA family ATPase [Verrucomicrobiae bacterium]|nr:AAA family ATPase [Verrucomicrobiae bacterium]